MRAALLFLPISAFLFTSETTDAPNSHTCVPRSLSQPVTPSRLTKDYESEARNLLGRVKNGTNVTAASLEVLNSDQELVGVILTSVLALKTRKGPKLYQNVTKETESFWKAYHITLKSWGAPFRDCLSFPRTWFYPYVTKKDNDGVGFFLPLKLNQCDRNLTEIFGGTHHCEQETTFCVPVYEYGETRGGYHCLCNKGYYHPEANHTWKGFEGEEIERGLIDSHRCEPCPAKCDYCDVGGVCSAQRDLYLKTVITGLQLSCMSITVILALVVFKQRKCKAIASGMWTILETILLGIFVLYTTIIVRFFEPSVLQCLLEPWARELGFIICYGAIILKLYRHLIDFRTRKAHRWIVKDTDLLKYLLIMVLSVAAYMGAYTAANLDFLREGFGLVKKGITVDGVHYESCRILWWDYVTEAGELTILIFGIHLGYASRNAKTQFHERNYFCAVISVELAVSTIFYISRIYFLPGLHPDLVLVVYFIRIQLTATLTLLLVFVPKFWYQQKQVRSLAQEYSCRIPVDAFKDANAHGPLTGNNSDADVGEVTLADMNIEDIRQELKRLYVQLEILKNKTICRDNPHISKRRGGRKAAHRRFSLQKKGSREKNLHGRHKEKKQVEETTEAEPSRTPEDSVCSNEGPSAIYSELPSTTAASETTK